MFVILLYYILMVLSFKKLDIDNRPMKVHVKLKFLKKCMNLWKIRGWHVEYTNIFVIHLLIFVYSFLSFYMLVLDVSYSTRITTHEIYINHLIKRYNRILIWLTLSEFWKCSSCRILLELFNIKEYIQNN